MAKYLVGEVDDHETIEARGISDAVKRYVDTHADDGWVRAGGGRRPVAGFRGVHADRARRHRRARQARSDGRERRQ